MCVDKITQLVADYEATLERYCKGQMKDYQWKDYCDRVLEDLIELNKDVLVRLKEKQ